MVATGTPVEQDTTISTEFAVESNVTCAVITGERPRHGGRGQLLARAGGDALAEQRNGQQAPSGGRADTEEPGAYAHGDAHVHAAEGGPSGVKGK